MEGAGAAGDQAPPRLTSTEQEACVARASDVLPSRKRVNPLLPWEPSPRRRDGQGDLR